MPFSLMFYLPLFALGMLTHEALQRRWMTGLMRRPEAGVAGVVCLIVATTVWPEPYGMIQLALYGVFFLTVAGGNPIYAGLGSVPALIVGECSFGIYLINGIVLSLMFVEAGALMQTAPTAWLPLFFPIATSIAVLVAAFGHVAVERPGIEVGKRLTELLKQRRLPAPGN